VAPRTPKAVRAEPSVAQDPKPADACVSLLEGFEIREGRLVVDVPWSTRRVVAFLALHRRPVLRVFVAGALWPDSPDARAAASLRSALWRLHRLGLTLVQAGRGRLSLDPHVRIDLHERLAIARRVLEPTQELEGGELETLILAGELLPDWYDDWLVVDREHFHTLRLHALEQLSDRLVALGRFPEAAEAALAAVAAEPLRESARRALVTAYLAQGNRVDALREYEAYRQLAREELGVDPSSLTDDSLLILARGSQA
jgi:DNA-binding SARP family transcriptional activator